MNDAAKKTADDPQAVKAGQAAPARAKEQEPESDQRNEEAEMVAEISSRADAVDRQAETAVQESIKEARLRQPEPVLAPDVEDAGVKSPVQEAEAVIRDGPTIDLGVTEEKYKEGLGMGAGGKSDREKTVFGTASLVALALWIARMMKLAHKHTMRIVFRKEAKSS